MKSFGLALRILTVLLFVATASLGAADDAEGDRKGMFRRGARLWSPYCGACHNARPAGERSPAEWDTIMMHMRVRANLSPNDAQAITEFLKGR